MSPAGLLSLALLVPAAPPGAGPKLQPGHELTFTGTITESVDRPGNRFRRAHQLEVRVFVLERRETWVDAAVLILLRRADDTAVSEAVPAVTGARPNRTPSPPAARLDLVRVHEDGTVHLLVPPGPAPLRLAPDTPARVLPAPPLDAFAPFEFGMFAPHVRAEKDSPWVTASTDPGRPAETWRADGFAFVNGERCAKLMMVQRSPDWEKPQGGQTSWQRVDEAEVSTQDGTARRVHRVIRQRDGIAPAPAVVIEVKYGLKEHGRLIGRAYDRYRHEIEVAYAAGAETAPLLRDAARLGPRVFEGRLAKLDGYLEETEPGTPYREAVLAVRRQLDAARRGEALPRPVQEEGGREGERERGKGNKPERPSPPFPVSSSPPPPAVGQPAPDFRAGDFRLMATRGKPVVLVFFMPGKETTDLSLAIADALQERYGGRLAVAPLAVFASREAGIRDRDRLKLVVPIHDGTAAGVVYGVETFPRFVVIDPAGKVRWMFAGVGAETGFLVREQVDALLAPPPGPAVTTGTTYPAGTRVPPPAPRR